MSGIVQRACPNVGAGRIRPVGRSLGTPAIDYKTYIASTRPEIQLITDKTINRAVVLKFFE